MKEFNGLNAFNELADANNRRLIVNSPKALDILFDGCTVYTGSGEEQHGQKLEPDHVQVNHKDGKIKAFIKEDTVALAKDTSSHVPQKTCNNFLQFCKDNEGEIRDAISQQNPKNENAIRTSFKGLGKQYDGKTIPKSKQENKRAQKRREKYQRPDDMSPSE